MTTRSHHARAPTIAAAPATPYSSGVSATAMMAASPYADEPRTAVTTFSACVTTTDRMLKISGVFMAQKFATH